MKDPDNPTFQEALDWLKSNHEMQRAFVKYFEDGRDGALSKVLSAENSEYGDTKRNLTAALYSELVSIFS